MAGPYYTNAKQDGIDYIAEADLEAIETGFSSVDTDIQTKQDQGDVLDDLNTLGAASSDGEVIVATGAGAFAYESGATLRTSIGVAIGTDVQAYDASLTSLASLATAANKLPYTTGVDTYAEADITAAGRALLDDASAADQLVTLGVTATAAEINYNDISSAGTAEASKSLVVDGSKNISGINDLGSASYTATSTDAGATAGPDIVADRNSASPAANDFLGRYIFRGRDDGANSTNYALIFGQIVDPADTSEDAKIGFQTVIGGSLGTRGYIGSGLVVGSPTGGDKGAGTINATAVYDDNVLLSCYVFDAAIDGAINPQKWNNKVPDRVEPIFHPVTGEQIGTKVTPRDHEPMLKFKGMLHGKNDPLNIDKYANHWKTKRHLPSLPDEKAFDPEDNLSTGDWVQRLIETVEIQAVLIEQLNQRLKALEP